MKNYNVKQLKNLRKQIISAAEAGAFDMSSWANQYHECRTTYCAAGLVVISNGWEISWSLDATEVSPNQGRTSFMCEKEGEGSAEIAVVASDILGLAYFEREALFHALGPQDDQDIEASEVVRVLDALIKRAELGLDHLMGSHGNTTRQALLDWHATV